jgi:hypothetical protein
VLPPASLGAQYTPFESFLSAVFALCVTFSQGRDDAPLPFAVKLGTSYMSQYGTKH